MQIMFLNPSILYCIPLYLVDLFQEIIDALATPGARGLLALLNEPLFDEVLIRRTKYGMDCLLLLLQYLPFDMEERDAAQVCVCVRDRLGIVIFYLEVNRHIVIFYLEPNSHAF
jgi:hypothetical protein